MPAKQLEYSEDARRALKRGIDALADAVKMLTKEDFTPARADKLMFKLAPFVSVFFGLAAFATIPFGDTLQILGREIQLQAVTLNVGILYVLGMISLGVYGLMMAGWASANNYALLGGQRAAALMISAEVAIGASIMGVVMVYGSLNMQDIARAQGLPLLDVERHWRDDQRLHARVAICTQPFAGAIFMALADADGAGVHHRWLRSRPGDYDQGTRRRLLTASLIPAAIQQRAHVAVACGCADDGAPR